MRKPNKPLTALALGLLALSCQAEVVHKERSLYRNILVQEEDGVRCMTFDRQKDSRQTCMQLSAPDRLVFDYSRMMIGALYLNPAPRRMLLIGLGGGSLPSALQKLYPGAQIDVVEIDPAVVRTAQKFFGFRPAAQTRVIEEDGRVFVKRALKQGLKYDLVMLDAFDHEYIPEHLLTREFLSEVKGLLSDKGVLAANTFSHSRLYDLESATYHSVFGPFYSLKGGNRIILTRSGRLPDKAELEANARQVEEKIRPFDVGSGWLLPKFSIEPAPPAGTRVLTDQYSPSNLLNRK